jgi:hypothetical protein
VVNGRNQAIQSANGGCRDPPIEIRVIDRATSRIVRELQSMAAALTCHGSFPGANEQKAIEPLPRPRSLLLSGSAFVPAPCPS